MKCYNTLLHSNWFCVFKYEIKINAVTSPNGSFSRDHKATTFQVYENEEKNKTVNNIY